MGPFVIGVESTVLKGRIEYVSGVCRWIFSYTDLAGDFPSCLRLLFISCGFCISCQLLFDY